MYSVFRARSPFSFLAMMLLALSLAMPQAASAAAPTQWQAGVGIDTSDHAIQGNAFFPGELSIHVGDSITWAVHSGEIHTVAFTYGPPPPELVGFDVVRTPAGGSTFNGSGWFNSGLLSTAPGLGSSYKLTFTKVGDFRFQCLVHATMQGALHVLPANVPLPHDQAFYNRQMIPQQNQLLAVGERVSAAGLSSALHTSRFAVTAGDGQLLPTASVAVLRFLPDQRVVRVGDSVTWTNLDPETPHTVTFGADPPGGPLGEFLPSGTDGSGHATVTGANPSINSGFLSASAFFNMNGTAFTVKFTKAGTFNYRCVLHDDLGMTGTVVVLPNS